VRPHPPIRRSRRRPARPASPPSSAPPPSGTTSTSTARPPLWCSARSSSRTNSRAVSRPSSRSSPSGPASSPARSPASSSAISGTSAALVFGQIVFSVDLSSGVAPLLAFVTLWAGFLARPLGGVIFGHLGDRIGRKNTLVITLVMMGIATVGIGLLPTYAQIGMWAPVLLVFLRIVQGVAVGGEWGGAVLIASENAPKGKGILYSAFAQQGSPAGNLLSTMAFFFLAALPTPQFMMWGWRIPFLLSGALVAVGLIIRLKLEESDAMKAVLARKKTVKL